MSPLDGERGWEILFCQTCGYAIEKCQLIATWRFCPLCEKKGLKVPLVDRYVVNYPECRVLKPKDERRQEWN
jgi:hypothetical protein